MLRFLYLFSLFCMYLHPLNGQNKEQYVDSVTLWINTYLYEDDGEAEAVLLKYKGDTAFNQNIIFNKLLGVYYYAHSQYDSSYFASKKTYEMCLKTQDSSMLNSLKNNMGIALLEMGKISEAVNLLSEVLEKRLKDQDTLPILSGYGNLIEAYQVLGTYDKVGELMSDVLHYQSVDVKFPQIFKRIYDLAHYIEFYKKNYNKALYYLRLSAKMNDLSYTDYQKASTDLGFGRVYMVLGQLDSALIYLKQAEEISNNQYLGILTAVYAELGQLYLNKNQTDKSFFYFKNALETAIPLDMKLKALNGLQEIYLLKKDFKKAFYTQKEIGLIKDSLSGTEVQKAVYDMELKYNLREKEIQIQNLETDSKIAKLEAEQLNVKTRKLRTLLLIVGILALASILILVGVNQNIKLKREKELLLEKLEQEKLENDKQQLEIQLFRSKMNPHFFFNALYSIQNFILTNQPMESSRYLGKFARLMRAVLELNDKSEISLEREIEILSDYLDLEKMRFDEKFDYQITTPSAELQLRLPPMIVQPFVENALVHGFSQLSQGGMIQIKFEVQEDENLLSILIEDNGKGYQPEQTKQRPGKKSIALQLTQKRLEILSKQFQSNYNFTIVNLADQHPEKSGTRVKLILPLILA